VTHITGILDEYWRGIVESERVSISPDALRQAGCTVAREEYRLIRERGYKATMLGGGARGTHHFTEMVGADMSVTLNWSTVNELIEEDAPALSRIDARVSNELRDEMMRSLPGFSRAFVEGKLAIEEAADFGPLVLFRGNFLNGYARLIDEIANRRSSWSLGK
jgi:transaldolase